jgi:protein phosphatase
MTLAIRACGLSDVGRNRAVNEDSFAIEAQLGLYLVADGMGGHGHGDVASQLAVESVRGSLVRDGASARRRWSRRSSSPTSQQRLRTALTRANDRLLLAVEEKQSLTGMGTTLVALLVDGSRAVVAHVGDSRAYRLSAGKLELLTKDHTWVAEQVTAGNLSEEQARSHPFKSVVTRALGGDREVSVELTEVELIPGDLYLLCSDGLTGMVGDDRIHRRLADSPSPQEACRGLVYDANRGGGKDNITALVLAVEEAA